MALPAPPLPTMLAATAGSAVPAAAPAAAVATVKEVLDVQGHLRLFDAALAERVIKGSKGVWKAELKAEVVMPPNPRVKPDEAARIVQGILGQK